MNKVTNSMEIFALFQGVYLKNNAELQEINAIGSGSVNTNYKCLTESLQEVNSFYNSDIDFDKTLKAMGKDSIYYDEQSNRYIIVNSKECLETNMELVYSIDVSKRDVEK